MRRYDVDDATLLRQVAEGDEAALRALFDRHAAWLQLRLRRRTSDPDLERLRTVAGPGSR